MTNGEVTAKGHKNGSRRKKKRARKGAKVVATVRAGKGAPKVDIKKREDGRGWLYYAEYQHPTKGRQRPSLQTDVLDEAKRNAAEIAGELALLVGQGTSEDLARIAQSKVDLGTVFDAYRRERMPQFVKGGVPNPHWINMDRVIRVAETLLGRGQVVCEIGESLIDGLKKRRLEGEFEIPARWLPDQFDRLILPAPPTPLGPCSPRTVRGEIALLSIIFNWASRHPVAGGGGRTLLAANPLKEIPFSAGPEQPRQPVMTEKRYQIMLEYAPHVEAISRGELRYQRHFEDGRVVYQRNPRGRGGRRFPGVRRGYLTTLLMLARGTGKRLDALINVRVGDVLLTQRQVRQKLLELGWPEDWAGEWPFGAIFWDPAHDKEGYSRVVPMSKRLHQQLKKYIAEMATVDPSALLFPAPSDPRRPARHAQVWRWFRRIEKVARQNGADLPTLKWGAWHPFRRQWRSERAGFFDDKLVALVGGWKRFNDANDAMNQGYLQYHPRALYLCAEYDPRRDAPSDGRVPGVNTVVHAPPAADASAPPIVTTDSRTGGDSDEPEVRNVNWHKPIGRSA